MSMRRVWAVLHSLAEHGTPDAWAKTGTILQRLPMRQRQLERTLAKLVETGRLEIKQCRGTAKHYYLAPRAAAYSRSKS